MAQPRIRPQIVSSTGRSLRGVDWAISHNCRKSGREVKKKGVQGVQGVQGVRGVREFGGLKRWWSLYVPWVQVPTTTGSSDSVILALHFFRLLGRRRSEYERRRPGEAPEPGNHHNRDLDRVLDSIGTLRAILGRY